MSATVLYMSMSLDGLVARPNEGPGKGSATAGTACTRAPVRGSLVQPGTSSFASALWERSSHKEACSGCIVSRTTPSAAPVKASMSVSSRNLELKAASVLAASYFLL